MSLTPDKTTQELEDAFRLFAETSRQMEVAYRQLEGRFAGLNHELGMARSERFRQLREKELLANRLERLLAALPAGILVLDDSGLILEANPAASELLGEPLTGLSWDTVRTRALAPGSGQGQEMSLHDSRVVSIALRSLGSEPGQIVLIHDLTENHKLRALVERQRSLASLGEMVAQLAHQVRTPLASAVLYSSHLRKSEITAERRALILDKTLFCLRELERQINDMLLFARSGHLAFESVDLAELAADLQRTIEPQLLASECVLTLTGMEGQIDGNHEALAGALLNLVSNALEMGAHTIRIAARIDAQVLEISVADDGPGVAAEIRPRIFEPFFTARPGGTGLGLAVVRTVVEAHSGRVALVASPSGGACFQLTLPRHIHPQFLPSGQSLPSAGECVAGGSLRRYS